VDRDAIRNIMDDLWQSLWQEKKRDRFRTDTVRRDSNPVEGVDVPPTIEVLNLPKIFTRIGDIMIRKEYDEAIKDIEGYRTSERNGVVIVGHPGIGTTMGSVRQAWVLIYTPPYLGKTTLLYYILVNRLLERKPTIFQKEPDVLFLFDDNGVRELNPSMDVDPSLGIHRNTWALVDCNRRVHEPAALLARDTSPYFLVIASSPRASRWEGVEKDRGRIALWFMKPFTLAELIQASVFLASISSLAYVILQSSTSRQRQCFL
jgi:hypothetical protein